MCECGHSGGPPAAQSMDEMEFERGLWYAAQYGDLERATLLLDRGVYVDKRDSSGYTALHYAARHGHFTMCKLLLDRGAAVDAITREGRVTPLSRASAVGHHHIVQLLLQRRANVRLKDSDGRTALHRAAMGAHREICQLLADTEPDLRKEVDTRGNTPGDYTKGTALAAILS